MINLQQKKQEILSLGRNLFHEIINLPRDVRSDDKERTGINIVVRNPNDGDLIIIPIENPSEKIIFYSVEKITRMEVSGEDLFYKKLHPFSHTQKDSRARLSFSSQSTKDAEKFRYAGGIALGMELKERISILLQVSTSGLKEEEDVLISLIVLCFLSGFSSRAVIEAIEAEGGEFPKEFKQKGNYLYNIVERYNY